uniref:recombinase family protein n=1 Tax=Anaerobutyricum hallii TaxID=39488 RepID=UPI003FF14935
MGEKKRVRMLLRVSSNQQLEEDGDLGIQRQLVKEFIAQHEEWHLDSKEYFEGSNSGYSNAVENRDILQQALRDAQRNEYDILAVYKDDRIGRRMWEIGAYVMQLKSYGVDIYTVKDGCISPESDDIMGQMMLALRYGNAQKSSSDTGMRVKDTAQKLVQQGKFVGGKAPYGYKLELSGEISKHGRALHHLVIIPERAKAVKHIYELSLDKEYGSSKIARELNLDEEYKELAPSEVWRGGTVTSILTNPIYAGYTAYKRREKKENGKSKRLDSSEWILSEEPNPELQIISPDDWNLVQIKRKQRGMKYRTAPQNKGVKVIARNEGMLPLIDVIYCGYCGCKCTNGSKYNYWTIKDTGERRASRQAIYKCQDAWQGVPHYKVYQFKAEKIEKIVFQAIAEYIDKLQENEDIFEQISENGRKAKKEKAKELSREQERLKHIQQKISVMEDKIPEAMLGEYPVPVDKLVDLIEKQRQEKEQQEKVIAEKQKELDGADVSFNEWDSLRMQIPTWKDVFLNADNPTKRVLVNKLIEKISVKEDEVVIRFKININEIRSKALKKSGSMVPENKLEDAWQGVPHYKVYQFKAEKIEKIVFQAIAEYIDKLQENEDIFEQISENGRKAKKEKAKELSREQERLKHIQQKISVMEDKIPEAMLGEYPVPVDKLVDLIEKQRQEKEQQEKVIAEKQKELDGADVSFNEWDSLRMQIPTWKDVFLNADNPTKRVLVNKLIEKISVKEDEVVIRFKININEIRSKALKKSGSMVPENKLEDKSVILDSLKIYPNPE